MTSSTRSATDARHRGRLAASFLAIMQSDTRMRMANPQATLDNTDKAPRTPLECQLAAGDVPKEAGIGIDKITPP